MTDDIEVRSVSSTGAEKGVKLARFSLIPQKALREVAEHYGRGSKKYSDHNWRKGYEWSKSKDALDRHLSQFWDGEDLDEETGSKHIIAAAWHCLALATFMDEQPAFDDRFSTVQARLKAMNDREFEQAKESIGDMLDGLREDAGLPPLKDAAA